MKEQRDNQDFLSERYCKPSVLMTAQDMLNRDELSEEDFLGAQCVLLLNGRL